MEIEYITIQDDIWVIIYFHDFCMKEFGFICSAKFDPLFEKNWPYEPGSVRNFVKNPNTLRIPKLLFEEAKQGLSYQPTALS